MQQHDTTTQRDGTRRNPSHTYFNTSHWQFGVCLAPVIRVNMNNIQGSRDQNLVLEFSTHFKICVIVLLFY